MKKTTGSGMASFLDVIGALMIYWGIKSLFSSATVVFGVIFVVIGIGCMALGEYLRKRKSKETEKDTAKDAEKDTAFEAWWAEIKAANLEPRIAQSQEVAVQVYKKNPQKRTLQKIQALNPSAAAYIAQKTGKKC